MSEASDKVNEQLERLIAKGLKGVSLFPGDKAPDHPDEFYEELSRMLDAIEENIGEPLKFNDSRKLTG